MAGKQFKFKRTGGAGAVSSVFGRTGDVTAQAGDYSSFYLGVPISKTVAQMQALALASSLITGQLYLISNQTYFAGGLSVIAISNSQIGMLGQGRFKNGAMTDSVTAVVEYDLTTNTVISVRTSYLDDGTATNVFISDNGNGAVGSWPFDLATISNLFALNPLIGGDLLGTITGVFLGINCTIMCGSGCGIIQVTAGSNSAVQAADTGGGAASIGNCTVGQNSVLTMVSWAISGFTLGDGKQIETASMAPGGAISGGYYIGDVSTVVVTNANVNANELKMSVNGGVVDMTNFSWAGILMIEADNSVTPFKTITAMPTDHNVKICNSGDENGLIIQDSDLSGGNIMLEASNTAITINKDLSGLEFLELKNNGTVICQQSATIRI